MIKKYLYSISLFFIVLKKNIIYTHDQKLVFNHEYKPQKRTKLKKDFKKKNKNHWKKILYIYLNNLLKKLKKQITFIKLKFWLLFEYLFVNHLKLIITVAIIYICIYLLRFYPGENIARLYGIHTDKIN